MINYSVLLTNILGVHFIQRNWLLSKERSFGVMLNVLFLKHFSFVFCLSLCLNASINDLHILQWMVNKWSVIKFLTVLLLFESHNHHLMHKQFKITVTDIMVINMENVNLLYAMSMGTSIRCAYTVYVIDLYYIIKNTHFIMRIRQVLLYKQSNCSLILERKSFFIGSIRGRWSVYYVLHAFIYIRNALIMKKSTHYI